MTVCKRAILFLLFYWSKECTATDKLNNRRPCTVLLGVDGVYGPSFAAALKNGSIPSIAKLQQESAWTLNAKTCFPMESAAAWSACFYAVEPQFLGNLFFHDCQHLTFDMLKNGSEEKFGLTLPKQTSFFKAIAPLKSAAIGNWPEFGPYLTMMGASSVDMQKNVPEGQKWDNVDDWDLKVVDRACKAVSSGEFDFVFVYFLNMDNGGHKHGSGPVYDKLLKQLDERIGKVLACLKPNDTVALVSDHSRDEYHESQSEFKEGQEHNLFAGQSMSVPWFIKSSKIKPGQMFGDIGTIDLMPTLLTLMGKKVPGTMRGKVHSEIFKWKAELAKIDAN